jgi:hypothetical protein
MINSTNINKCTVCGEFRGLLVHEKEPSSIARGFCRCEPEGWEICTRHEGHARRRFRTVRVVSSSGEHRYFSVYAMMAPCRVDTCFKPTDQFLEDVRKIHDLMYMKA